MKKILLSTTAAILVATAVNAGTVTSSQVTVASELNTLPASIAIGTGFMDANTTAYSPSTIALTDLSNPIFNIFPSDSTTNDSAVGTIALLAQAGKQYVIVDDLNGTNGDVGNEVIAVATTTSGAKLSFDGTGATATNGHNYLLQVVNDGNATVGQVLVADGDAANVIDGNLTVSSINSDSFIRVNIGSGDTNEVNDRASNSITSAAQQMSVTMNTLFDGIIDSTNNSYTFVTGVTTDVLDFNITSALKTLPAVGAADDFVVKITSTNALPAAADYNLTEVAGTSGLCTLTNANLLTCTLTNAGLDPLALDTKNYTVTATVNGTSDILLATEFSAEIAYDFADADAADYVTAVNPLKDLPTAGDAGEWTYYGYNAIVPSINTSTGNTTYLKFNNDSNNQAYTYWTVTGYDGCKTTSLVQADALTFNGTGFDTITDGTLGAGVSGLWNATTIIAAANASGTPLLANGTTTACTLNERSSIEVLVTTTRNLVHGTATMRVAGQSDKIIPIYTRNQNTDGTTGNVSTDDYLSN